MFHWKGCAHVPHHFTAVTGQMPDQRQPKGFVFTAVCHHYNTSVWLLEMEKKMVSVNN